jgi:filamentous hemagglutinin
VASKDSSRETEDSVWPWTRVPRAVSRLVVVQSDEDGCGPACGEMLLRDRGVEVDQTLIAEELELPVDGHALALRLGELSPVAWLGGGLVLPRGPDLAFLERFSSARATWAALLEPLGPRRVGHWVVVDGVGDGGLVQVRDPVGAAYGIPVEEFLTLWRYTVVVVEEVRR